MLVRRLGSRAFVTLTVLVTLAAACAARPRAMASVRTAPRLVLPERMLVRVAGKIVSVDLEDYVVDTILAEVSPLNETDDVAAGIFEVQAVIARTYAVAHMICRNL